MGLGQSAFTMATTPQFPYKPSSLFMMHVPLKSMDALHRAHATTIRLQPLMMEIVSPPPQQGNGLNPRIQAHIPCPVEAVSASMSHGKRSNLCWTLTSILSLQEVVSKLPTF
jgi:hypothetical protein